jgi:hypothetical protein
MYWGAIRGGRKSAFNYLDSSGDFQQIETVKIPSGWGCEYPFPQPGGTTYATNNEWNAFKYLLQSHMMNSVFFVDQNVQIPQPQAINGYGSVVFTSTGTLS